MFVHNVGAGLLCYSLGIALMSEKPERDWWKQMLNGPTIATAVALVANWSGFGALMVERLVFLDQAVRWLGQASVPISLLAIGAVTADQFGPDGGGISRGNSTRMVVAACILRLLILSGPDANGSSLSAHLRSTVSRDGDHGRHAIGRRSRSFSLGTMAAPRAWRCEWRFPRRLSAWQPFRYGSPSACV